MNPPTPPTPKGPATPPGTAGPGLPQPLKISFEHNEEDKLAAAADLIANSAEKIGSTAERMVLATEKIANSPTITSAERGMTLRRAGEVNPETNSLWMGVALHTDAISFASYERFIENVLCSDPQTSELQPPELESTIDGRGRMVTRQAALRHLPGGEMYELLKTATEAFLLLYSGVYPDAGDMAAFTATPVDPAARDAAGRLLIGGDAVTPLSSGVARSSEKLTVKDLRNKLGAYLGSTRNNYLDAIARSAYSTGVPTERTSPFCGIEGDFVTRPLLLELIWNYWMEEAMLTQTTAAITRRFQNVRRAGPGPDPLGELELHPLRSMSGLLWGYLQDEPHRLSLARRASEYSHQYGLTLWGRAVPQVMAADPRPRFLEAFHNLLRQAARFYREDSDTTVIADAFPVLNSIREVHLVLAEGAHNQFRDLPWTARVEMLMQQWLLARPEMREFLRGRQMVPYPEGWMGSVDAMKRLQGWGDTSVIHFRDLARFGERLLLSIRYGNWTEITSQDHAVAWLRYWKEEVQGYIHSYFTATGVNLSDDAVEVSNRADVRYVQPSYHLRNRLLSSRRALNASR